MENPYRNRPASAFWRSAVAGVPDGLVDPVAPVPFTITARDSVATAGSCFAQHIARHLAARGFPLMRTEPPPEGAAGDKQREGYALFSANYGNIYTARHLLRLFEEAFGLAAPAGIAWQRPDGAFIDALRPRLAPAGHADAAAVLAARAGHLDAVREVFEACDVFVFTLGLTEAWVDTRDGTAFPLPPGVVALPAAPDAFAFHNFTVDEVRADLFRFIEGLREVNPAARCILTVSPVPLVATYTDAHVLTATSYSKAVLRVAAEEAARRFSSVAYFPSFEIITGAPARGRYHEPDLRGIAPAGVARVLSLFEEHFMAAAPAAPPPAAPPPVTIPIPIAADPGYEALLRVVCDEDELDPGER